jgi:hypothetical protein
VKETEAFNATIDKISSRVSKASDDFTKLTNNKANLENQLKKAKDPETIKDKKEKEAYVAKL